MRLALGRLGFVVVAVAVATPVTSAAEEKKEAAAAAAEGPTNDDCMACHKDPSTQRADGKPVIVDEAKWKASIHGEVSTACTDCHADLAGAEMPHPDKLKPAQCASCHKKAVPEFAKGVHAGLRNNGKEPNATCTSCHGGPHEILASGDRRSPTNHLNIVETCAKCHDDPKLIASEKLPSGIVQSFGDSIHGRGLKKAGLTVAPTCATCHGAHEVIAHKDPRSPTFGLNQSATCGKCHEGITEKYDVSIHAAKVKEGKKDAPVCASCHTAHKIQRSDLPDWALGVISECGSCHEESLHSYRDTFHGSVTELGFSRMAKCADCHGAHDIVAKTDPRSPVAAANLVATCQKCHPNAGAGFVKYDPHARPHDKTRSPSLYITALLMKLLLVGVMGTFGLHTLLWFVRILIERAKRRPADGKGGD